MKWIPPAQPGNLRYFYEISQIPRPSFHEERVVDYLEQFAGEHGLWYIRDAMHNLIMKKPGSKGREQEAPLILQAHTDMVCAKEAWSTHDFSKDPIDIREEDGWLTANGTTLGADDGAGVANILGLLAEPDLSHPPLECLFTVQEEDGMGGAKGIDLSCLSGKRMIGLDGIQEGTTIYSASSVWACKLKADFTPEISGNPCYRLQVSGLTSGHGALMIGAERANAIKAAARLLRLVPGLQLSSMAGGCLVHVIPGSCSAEFTAPAALEELNTLLLPAIDQLRKEYAETDPGLSVMLESAASCENNVLPVSETSRILKLLYLLPVGAHKRTGSKPEQVEGSFNLSILNLSPEHMEAHYVCRSNYPVSIQELRSTAEEYAALFRMDVEPTMEYAGHYVPTDSPLIQLWSRVYEEDTGKPLGLTFIHSALDAGTIFEKQGLTDLIVIMPTTLDVHTPRERVNLDSFCRTYQYLKEILARC